MLTVDDISKAASTMTKYGYDAQVVGIKLHEIFNEFFKPVRYEIILKNNHKVRIWDYEIEEFKMLYKYPPMECKNEEEFIEKVAVIRL